MKGFHWTILVVGIMLSLSSSAFRADDPATPYDESEGAFSFIALGATNNLVACRPPARVIRTTAIFRLQPVDALVYLIIATSAQCTSQRGLKLLSKTLLC